MATKKCPVCKSEMTATYTYVRKGKDIIKKVYAWICTKCSYTVSA